MSLDQSSLYEGLRIGAMLGRTPRTPYLEKQEIPEIQNATVVSIACRRLNMVRKTDRIYIAYISNGIGHVIYADPVKNMQGHNWIHTTFEVECEDIEIRFNGRCMRNGPEGREFITDDQPWVFWVHDGRCRGQILGNLGWMEFASEHCTKVSSIIDYAKDWLSDGKGMFLFLLLDGDIYYRQLIDGNWYDAELLTGTPENVKWTDISAFRTWDYRIGVQALSTTGSVYEIFSQFEGFGKKNYENLYISSITVYGPLTRIYYHDGFENEHLYISNILAGALYGGLYHTGLPVLVQAYNLEDSDHDWGKIAVFVFDKHLLASDVLAQYSTFKIVDSRGTQFVATSATLGPDGKSVTLTFLDFNSARGTCSAAYIPGTVTSMAGTTLEASNVSWVPQNLVAPSEPAPEPLYITNVGYEDAGIVRIRYYSKYGQILVYTEYIAKGSNGEYGAGANWASIPAGSAVSGIIENVIANVDVYEVDPVTIYGVLSTIPSSNSSTSQAGWEFKTQKQLKIIGLRARTRATVSGTAKIASSDGTLLAETTQSEFVSGQWTDVLLGTPVILDYDTNYIIMIAAGDGSALVYGRSPTVDSNIMTYIQGRYGALPGTTESGTYYGVDIIYEIKARDIFHVYYYSADGQTLTHTENVYGGEDAYWGSGQDWSYEVEGEVVSDILENIVADKTVYKIRSGSWARADSLVEAANTVLLTHTGSRQPAIKTNNGEAACIFCYNAGGSSYGGNWFALYSFSKESAADCAFSCPTKGAGSIVYNGTTYYYSAVAMNRNWGGAAIYNNPCGFPEMHDVQTFIVNGASLTAAGMDAIAAVLEFE